VNLQTLIPIALKASVFVNVFALGLRASAPDATYLFRRPGELIRAILAMNVVMPLFAVGLVTMVELKPPLKLALVTLAISPIPPLIPKKIVQAGGRVEYVTGLLIAIGLLAIIFVPLALEVMERVFNLPLRITAVSVATLVVVTTLLPIGLGIAVRTIAPSLADRAAKPVAVIAGIVLLACVVAILAVAAPGMKALVGDGTLAALAAFVVVGLSAGYLLGGPERENRTALAMATASRHPGIAVAIAQANFPEQKLAMAAVLLYLLVNAVVSIPFSMWTKRR
jgi:BASS family bile acid:Na+ symporter